MSNAFDNERFGSKVPHYWEALKKIPTEVFLKGRVDKKPVISEDELKELIKSILVHLKDATNSNIAFVTDSKGKFLSIKPGDKQLKVDRLPLTKTEQKKLKGLESLVKEGEPFIVKKQVIPGFEGTEKETQKYLDKLGVSSLFLVRLKTQHGIHYIGMADGKSQQSYLPGEDELPYRGEDKQFVSALMSMLTATVDYGIDVQDTEKEDNERHYRSDRYFRARVLGEWGFLARASEDYASKWRETPTPPKDAERPCKGIFDTIKYDDLLADYLDAELCWLIYDPDEIKRKQKKKQGSDGPDSHTSTILLELFKIRQKAARTNKEEKEIEVKKEEEFEEFNVQLRDNKKWVKETDSSGPINPNQPKFLDPTKNQRTALALARICLWAAYMDWRAISDQDGAAPPEGGDKVDLDGELKPLRELSWKQHFYDIPDWLIGAVESGIDIDNIPDNVKDTEFEVYVDLVRTYWQKIHYLSRDDMRGTLQDRIKEIGEIYYNAWKITAPIIKAHLKSSEDLIGKERTKLDNGQKMISQLCIDSDWLFIWLISNVLLSKNLNEYYGLPLTPAPPDKDNGLVSPISKARYLMYLSQGVLYVLHCIRNNSRKLTLTVCNDEDKELNRFRRPPFADVPLELPSSRSDAQLYILSEYAYREVGVDREFCIFERLMRQLRFELPLYAAHDFYRDHLYHVIDVCLLGELLLRSYKPSGKLRKSLADVLTSDTPFDDSQEVFKNWYIAALFHDIGYVVEQADRLLAPVEYIKGEGLNEFAAKLKKGLDEGKQAVLQVINQIINNDIFHLPDPSLTAGFEITNPTDHGIVAWLYLRNLLENIKYPLKGLSPALLAIARHNLPFQNNVNVEKEPLTLLLMLCDHLQEWGRPRIGPDPLSRTIVEALRFSEQPELKPKVRMKEICINGLKINKANNGHNRDGKNGDERGEEHEVPHPGQNHRVLTEVNSKELEFVLPHIESREGDFEPVISWLLFCRDLQCLAFDEIVDDGAADDDKVVNPFGFNITISLNHLSPRMWQLLPWRPLEMDLLEEYANTYKPASYLCKWVEAARSNDLGIQYQGDRDRGEEKFIIKLHKLESPLPGGLDDQIWKGFYKWKWRWLGQKFITLSLGSWFPDNY